MRLNEAQIGVHVRRNSGPDSFVPDGPGVPSRRRRIGVIAGEPKPLPSGGPARAVPVRWLNSSHIELIAIHRLLVVPPEELELPSAELPASS